MDKLVEMMFAMNMMNTMNTNTTNTNTTTESRLAALEAHVAKQDERISNLGTIVDRTVDNIDKLSQLLLKVPSTK